MGAKMLGRKRDVQSCCPGHDTNSLTSRTIRRKWVRINRHREERAWRKEQT